MHVYSMSQWLSQVSNCVIFSRFDLCQVGNGLVSRTCGFCYTVRLRKKETARKTQDKTVGQTWIWIHFVASRAHIPRSGAQSNRPKEATK
jgi:hypothetical protein